MLFAVPLGIVGEEFRRWRRGRRKAPYGNADGADLGGEEEQGVPV